MGQRVCKRVRIHFAYKRVSTQGFIKKNNIYNKHKKIHSFYLSQCTLYLKIHIAKIFFHTFGPSDM